MPGYLCKSDKAYIYAKRGDSGTSPNKHTNSRVWDGMVSVIDPVDSGWLSPPVISEWMQKVYLVLEIDRNMLPALLDVANCSDDLMTCSDMSKYRSRKGFLDFSDLATKLDVPDLLTKIYGGELIPVVDAHAIVSGADLKESVKADFSIRPLIKDINAITSGSYTIGSGGNYATISAFADDMGNLTGDITGTIISNSSDSSSAVFDITQNGYNIFLTGPASGTGYHYGIPGNGYICTTSVAGGQSILLITDGTGGFYVVNMYIKNAVSKEASTYGALTVGNTTVTSNWFFDSLMIDLDNTNYATTGRGIFIGDNSPYPFITNSVIWDGSHEGIFYSSTVNNSTLTENVSIYDCAYGFYISTNAGSTIRNCYAGGCGTADFYIPPSDCTTIGRYNASADSTATGSWFTGSAGNAGSKTLADNIVSTDDSSTFFMAPRCGSFLDGGGETNASFRTECIRRKAVPGQKGTSIGAAEPTRMQNFVRNLRRKS